ncbi:MAG: hypothetical protein IT365_29365 [Candidatus Hydrogenedentes bacterium]|nr:hypothetical protein [Candidatus Hydrogenedentota bacterium]
MQRKAVGPTLAVLSLLTLASCPPSDPPQLRFTEVVASTMHALPGERVTISWRIANTALLKEQALRSIPLVLQGDVLATFTQLEETTRSISFDFAGPETIQLILEDENTIDNPDIAADVVTLNILSDEDAKFTATFVALSDTNYPRLGYDENGASEISFSAFLGFFDRPGSREFTIDVLEPYLDPEQDFRGYSYSESEVDGFLFAEGCRYTAMPYAPFRKGSEGLQVRAELERTDAYLFGGAFAYAGDPFDIKTDDGNETGFRGTSLAVEPIFMAIALDISFVSHTYEVGDIQVGNLSQGLVATLTSGKLFGDSGHTRGIHGSFQTTWDNSPASTGTITGNLKNADLAVPVSNASGDTFDAFVKVESAEWSMPFLSDLDFGNRILVAN